MTILGYADKYPYLPTFIIIIIIFFFTLNIRFKSEYFTICLTVQYIPTIQLLVTNFFSGM